MEVPRLGVDSELQLQAYATASWDLICIFDLHHSSQQRRILNPLSEARFSGATPAAYGGSQARGRIRAVAAGLCQRHSNVRTELYL